MKTVFVVLGILLLCGCSTSSGRLSVIVPAGVTINEFGLEHSTVKHNITGSDTAPILLFVPLGQPSFDLAVHDALQKGRGQILPDALVTDTTRWFVLFGWNRIEVSGNVVDLQ